jgi:myosin heavy subunit
MEEHALSFDKSTKIWIPHPNDVWLLCEILSVDEHQGIAIVRKNEIDEGKIDEILTINLSETQQYHPSHNEELDNLCQMNNFHEAPLLYSLKKRSQKQKIYTRIGDVLISVNPYLQIPGLYDNCLQYFLSNQDSDSNLNEISLPPHVFQIANNALSFLLKSTNLTNDTNQSIIISGESGAGKTEASKKVIQFLIDIDNHLRHQDTLSSSDQPSLKQLQEEESLGGKINRRIWESTYVFESFGNAKTIRNDNSSRFGKFIKLQYGSNNRLVTANAETFLLEKSRLTSISSGERNYHVFYQLFRGQHETVDLSMLGLTQVADFKILLSDLPQPKKASSKHSIQGSSQGSLPEYPDADRDLLEFQHLCQALITLGCTAEDMKAIWQLLSSILHLGNCYATPPSTPTSVGSSSLPEENPVEIVSTSFSIEQISAQLGVSVALLKRALTVRVIQAMNRQSFTSKCLTEEETLYNLKALIKHLYGTLFQWIQSIINQSFEENEGNPSKIEDQDEICGLEDITVYRFIGILDIFGFEIFQENSFEQLW